MKILVRPMQYAAFAVILVAILFCPFVRVPSAGNWTFFELNQVLFYISIGLLALGLLFMLAKQIRYYIIFTYIFSGWCLSCFLAVYFKMNNIFGLQLLDSIISKTIELKWGWVILFIGAILLLLSIRPVNSPTAAK